MIIKLEFTLPYMAGAAGEGYGEARAGSSGQEQPGGGQEAGGDETTTNRATD